MSSRSSSPLRARFEMRWRGTSSPLKRLATDRVAVLVADRHPDGVVRRCDSARRCVLVVADVDRSDDATGLRVELEDRVVGLVRQPDGAGAGSEERLLFMRERNP